MITESEHNMSNQLNMCSYFPNIEIASYQCCQCKYFGGIENQDYIHTVYGFKIPIFRINCEK